MLETSAIPGGITSIWVYNLRFSYRLDKALPAVGECCESINRSMASFGFHEKLLIRSHAFSVNLNSSQPLAEEDVGKAQASVLNALRTQSPELEFASEGWLLILKTERTDHETPNPAQKEAGSG